jgi:hypothetical protein
MEKIAVLYRYPEVGNERSMPACPFRSLLMGNDAQVAFGQH